MKQVTSITQLVGFIASSSVELYQTVNGAFYLLDKVRLCYSTLVELAQAVVDQRYFYIIK